MSDNFYIEFEKNFRGSSDTVKSRMAIYLPIIKPLHQIGSVATAIDLGCGRGEWLQLLIENNFKAQGFDLDDRMIDHSMALGLNIEKLDAIRALEKTPPASQFLITAFHLVEHLKFDDLRNLIDLSLLALKPGGLLILETPNPENMLVATLNFYLDPTHLRPIPPLLLDYLCKYSGFERTKILRLGCENKLDVGLNDILGYTGIAQDYAVIAQKKIDSMLPLTFKSFEEIKDLQYPFDAFQEYDLIRSNAQQQLITSIKGLEARQQSLEQTVEARQQTVEARQQALEASHQGINSSFLRAITRVFRNFQKILVK